MKKKTGVTPSSPILNWIYLANQYSEQLNILIAAFLNIYKCYKGFTTAHGLYESRSEIININMKKQNWM